VHWTKALVAVLGAMIILYSDNFTFGFWKGIFLIQLSNLFFALGQVYYKQIIEKNSEVKQIEGFAVLFFGGVLISSIFSLINTDFHSLSVNTDQLLTLIYLGAIASGLGFFLWNYGVTKAAAGTIAVMNNLKIPLGVIFSFILLNEDVNIIQLILGTIVFLAGFWIDSFKKLFIKN
jgi:drug/metabolite transporter (DMT)-like permease